MSKNFFDSNGNSDLAKRLCADCRVQTTCLDYAIRTNQGHGIWGGLDTGQRAKAKRKKPALREKYIESIIKPYRRH